MNLVYLNTFIVTAEENSFSKAARRLFLTPPSLTQQINQLERELGFKLFYRNYNGIVLTKAGEEFYAGAKRMTQLMEKTVKQATAVANGESILRISATSPKLAETIKKFELLYPHINVHFIDIPYDGMEYGLDCLINEEIDLFECEYTTQIVQKNLSFTKLYDTHLCAFVSFRHALAQQSFVTLEDIKKEYVIIYKYLFSANESLKTAGFNQMEIINIRCSWTDIMNAAEKGSVYLMEHDTAKRLCPYGVLIPIKPDIMVEYGLAYKKNRPLLQDFLDLL